MNSIHKRLLSSLLVLVMVFVMGSVSAFAAEPVTDTYAVNSTVDNNTVVPLSTEYLVGAHVGSSSKSKTSGSFTIASGVKKATMKVQCYVSSPCTLFISIKNSSGKSLGSTSINFLPGGTNSGTFNLSPSTLGNGKYTYEYWFDTSGISYQVYLKAIF